MGDRSCSTIGIVGTGSRKAQKAKRLSPADEAHLERAILIVAGVAIAEINVPRVRRIAGVDRSRPKMRRGGIGKDGFVNSGIVNCSVHNRLQFSNIGKSPIIVASEGTGEGYRLVPGILGSAATTGGTRPSLAHGTAHPGETRSGVIDSAVIVDGIVGGSIGRGRKK